MIDLSNFKPVTDDVPDSDAIHGHFGLTYASYLVLPRVLLQSMPDEWQTQFVKLLREYDDAVSDIKQADVYDVIPGREVEYGDLTDVERQLLDVTVVEPDLDAAGEYVDPDATTRYYDKNGDEHESWHRALVPVADPLPSYNRGRTRVPLNATQEA